MDRKNEVLRQYFGFSSFHEGQEELIDAICAGRDVFGVMPTGGGKSLCYQLPALLMPGLTVVVSPLISLMKDQVMALTALGVPAAYINSSLTSEEARGVYARLYRGEHKLVYVAPERLETPGFLSAMQAADISLVAVDEAHCISQWGQDFRPSYLRIPAFLEKLPRRPALAAFTATATPEVRRDVERLLGLRSPLRVTTGFDRPNLRFDVLTPEDKYTQLVKLLRAWRDRSGIVYCSTRKSVESVCESLKNSGFPATRYHAGLEDIERRRNQEDFLYDRSPIMVATNAFGMGIDKSNVSFVVHYNMPKSLEAYYQEAGRAGRDGSEADCVLLFSRGDVQTARFLIENSGDNPDLDDEARAQVQERDLERLRSMVGYCETTGCYRGYILGYFGQEHPESCSKCGNCSSNFVEIDITKEAQMVLSCIQRVRGKLRYYVGQTVITLTLMGSRDKHVLGLGLDTLSTYGIMRGTPRERIRQIITALREQGYILVDGEYPVLKPTERAKDVLFGGEAVTMRVRRAAKPARSPARDTARGRTREPQPAAFAPDDNGNGLLDALKALRLKIAREEGVPLYVVFSNATLLEMVKARPATVEELLDIPGVGTVKAKRYGEAFLETIAKYM